MSVLKTTFVQHPSATSPAIELTAEGTVVLPLSGIGDLADVDEGSGAADGDVLTYDGSSNLWLPQAIPAPSDPTDLDASVITSGTFDSARIPPLVIPFSTTGSTPVGERSVRFGNQFSIVRVASGSSSSGNATITVNTNSANAHTTRSGLMYLVGRPNGFSGYQSYALYHYSFSSLSSGNSQLVQLARNFYGFDNVYRVQLSLTASTANRVNVIINSWSTDVGTWWLDFIPLGEPM